MKTNRMSGKTFVFNQDCMDVNYFAPRGKALEWTRDWYRRVFSAGAQVLVADIATPDVVQTKDTPTGEMWGIRFGESEIDPLTQTPAELMALSDKIGSSSNRFTQHTQTIIELIAQGTDTLHLACEEGRKAGAIVLVGVRTSDAHQGYRWEATSDLPNMSMFMMSHPEWCNTWKNGELDCTLNYAVPEVRAHRLQLMRELATNYDIDGMELNWLRWPRHFPEGTMRENMSVLTSFMGEVRKMLDDVSQEKGVPRMILGHRVPVTIDECFYIGCDVPEWIKNGYADFLAPMDYLHNDLNLQTDEFVNAVKDTDSLVYPGIGSLRYSFGRSYIDKDGKQLRRHAMHNIDQFRATAANWYAWGASGGSTFNMYLWESQFQDFYTQAIGVMSNQKNALSGPRHYVYLPVWKDHNNGIGPTGRLNAQNLTFGADTIGRRQVFYFRMADGRNGEKLSGSMLIRIFDAVPDDEFVVDINGETIPSAKLLATYIPNGEFNGQITDLAHQPDDGTFDWPAHTLYEISLADCPPFKGDNELGISLKERADLSVKDPVMEALEVKVH